MKGLVIGDQHFKVDNIDQVEIFIDKLKEYLNQNTFDFIVSGGDLLDTHERLHTLALNKADEYLKLLASHAKTFVLVGNHDMINPSQFLTTNHWLNVYKGWSDKLIVVDQVVHFHVQNKHILFCPYVPDGRFIEALETMKDFDFKKADVIFGHQTLDGVKMGAIKAENVENWSEDFPNVVAFHVHDSQNVQENLFYTGSCMQHSFGENGSKYIYEIKSNIKYLQQEDDIQMKNSIVLEKVILNLPKKKIIHCTTDELENMKKITDIIPEKFNNENYQIKLVVKGSISSFKVVKKRSDVKNLLNKFKVLFKSETPTIQEEKVENNEIEQVHTDFQTEFTSALFSFFEKKGNKNELIEYYKRVSVM
jgi:DNA repair exonuclease SbcCD nuclease subunit